jgi:hypothetical protein
MPEPIPIPGPLPEEESRQMAKAVADLHFVVATVVEARGELVPGEAVDELTSAWNASEGSMRQLAINLVPANVSLDLPPPQPRYPIPVGVLDNGDLTGAPGHAKRTALQRFKDGFLMFWNSIPRTDEKRTKAAGALSPYLELGATVVSSIPGYEKVVELLSLTKQLVDQRAKRGI